MRLTALVALALTLPVAAQQDTSAPPPQGQLAGFTEGTTIAYVGIFSMTRMCDAEFPGSRMCFVDEARNTIRPPAIPGGWQAWIRGHRTCSDWGAWNVRADDSGTVMDWRGFLRATQGNCDEENHVACCLPARHEQCLVGDADGDGKLSSNDARLIQRAAIGLIPQEELRCAAPVD